MEIEEHRCISYRLSLPTIYLDQKLRETQENKRDGMRRFLFAPLTIRSNLNCHVSRNRDETAQAPALRPDIDAG